MKRLSRLLPVIGGAVAGGAIAFAVASGSTTTHSVTTTVVQPANAPALPTSFSNGKAQTINQLYKSVGPGVVDITTSSSQNTSGIFGFGQSQPTQGEGAGVVFDKKGDILTDQHVVSGASSIKVTFWNGKTYDAHVVGTDQTTDLAVVKVDAPGSMLHPLDVGDSSAVQVGDGVVAIGAPFGLEETVTSGIVSALHRSIRSPASADQSSFTISDSIQTDAAINHGNSGGPLLNTSGQVIGINAQIKSDSGDNAGVGFAIPSNTIRAVVTQLISTGKAKHAYLGVRIDSTASNARIEGVPSGTPAADAGLKAGDVVTSLGGTKISTADELASVINAHKPGDRVTVVYTRGGESHSVQLTLATRPS